MKNSNWYKGRISAFLCLGVHDSVGRVYREDSSGSDDGEVVTFIVGSEPSSLRLSNVPLSTTVTSSATHSSLTSLAAQNSSHPMNSFASDRFVFIYLIFLFLFYVI